MHAAVRPGTGGVIELSFTVCLSTERYKLRSRALCGHHAVMGHGLERQPLLRELALEKLGNIEGLPWST